MECISGSIASILFHRTSEWSASGNKYLISKFDESSGKRITVKGEMNNVVYGWTYKLYGSYGRDSYGDFFAFDSFEPVIDRSHEGMADFLDKHIPQIGKIRSRAIVDHFGEDSFTILKTDISRLLEIKRKDFTPTIIGKIKEYFE